MGGYIQLLDITLIVVGRDSFISKAPPFISNMVYLFWWCIHKDFNNLFFEHQLFRFFDFTVYFHPVKVYP